MKESNVPDGIWTHSVWGQVFDVNDLNHSAIEVYRVIELIRKLYVFIMFL
jgi:uncharacterized membrane protein YdfJ with MMPL/SSD domain